MTRLSAVCSLIERADVIADVGCDHGKVAEYCAENELSRTVIASDISAKCLEKAKKRLSRFGKKAKCVECDGICYTCDEAVIAGMGGLLIADILKNAYALPKVLVLLPHRDADVVRNTVCALGYTIERDEIIKERGRFYMIIKARLTGNATELEPLQALFGINLDRPNAVLKEYLQKVYATYSVAPESNREKLDLIRSALTAQDVHINNITGV